MSSSSKYRNVRYNMPGLTVSNSNAAVRSMSSYPYEFHSRNGRRTTGIKKLLGRGDASTNLRFRVSGLRFRLLTSFFSINAHLRIQPEVGVAPLFLG
jgi:hypothetical protein